MSSGSKDVSGGVSGGTISTTEPENKEPIPIIQLDENAPVEEQHDPIEASKRYNELKNKTISESTGSAGSGFSMGTTSSNTVPDEESILIANEIKKEFKDKKNIDIDELYNEIKDFPQDAYKWENQNGETPFSKERLMNLRRDNFVLYTDIINGVKNQYDIAQKTGDWAEANNFINLKTSHNVDEAVANIQEQKNIINRVFDTDEEREVANERLKSSAYVINPSTAGFDESYNNSGLASKITPSEYSGLLTLKAYEPAKYEQTLSFLNTPVEEIYTHQLPFDVVKNIQAPVAISTSYESKDPKDGRLSQKTIDEKIGVESRLRELAAIGRDNETAQLDKNNKEIDQQIKILPDGEEKDLLIGIFNENVGKINQVINDWNNDDKRFPLTTELKLDRQIADITGQEPGLLNSMAIKFALQTDNPRKAFFNMFGDNPSLQRERLGEMQSTEQYTYLPEQLRRVNSPVLTVYPKDVEKSIKDIYSNKDLNETQKKEKARQILFDNQSQIKTITNPELGKSKNFFSKATAYTMANFMGDIGGMAFTMAANPIKGKVGEMLSLGTLMHNGHYTHAVEQGMADPNGYANLHSGIDMLAATFGTQYDLVKKLVIKNPATKNMLNGISKDMWESIVSKDKTIIGRTATSIKSSLVENGKMVALWGGVVPATHELTDNAFYDKNTPVSEIVSNSFNNMKEFAIGQLPFVFAHTYTGYKRESNLRKSMLWEIGDNAEMQIQKIKEQGERKEFTLQEVKTRTETVKEISKLINEVPVKDAKGIDLTDEKKVDYLYNLYIKNKANSEKSSLPEGQREKADHTGMVADYTNGLLLETPTDVQLQSRVKKIESELTPEKDTDGKNKPVKDEAKLKAELEAVNKEIEHRASFEKVKMERKTFVDTKLSQPLEGRDEQGVPTSDIDVKFFNDKAGEVNDNFMKVAFESKDPKDIEEGLKYVSDQWFDTESRSIAEGNFPPEIIKAAKERFPQEENTGLEIKEGTEAAPPPVSKVVGEVVKGTKEHDDIQHNLGNLFPALSNNAKDLGKEGDIIVQKAAELIKDVDSEKIDIKSVSGKVKALKSIVDDIKVDLNEKVRQPFPDENINEVDSKGDVINRIKKSIASAEDYIKSISKPTEPIQSKVVEGNSAEPKNESTNETQKTEAPKDTKQAADAPPDNSEPNKTGEGAGKEPPKEPPVDTKELDKMASNIPNGGEIKKYLSGDTIKKYEGGELRNDQEIIAQELEPALRHGIETIDKAKEIFGDSYVEKTLDYIEAEKLSPENKALLYVTLENDMAKRVLAEPDNVGLKKQQDLVRTKSQAYLRSNSLAINMGRLRKFAETGYDISKVTDKFFSSKELEDKTAIEKTVQADADTINKAAEEAEVNKETDNGIAPDLEQKIKEGVDAEITKIYEQLPKEKKTAVDKAIKALDNIHAKLRSKTYDATIGIPIAIIDGGVVTIRAALKAGVKAAKAVELGIEKIKEKWGKEWDKEDAFRKDYLNGLKSQGILDAEYKKQTAKEYRMLETERNRQLEKVGKLKEKQKQLEQGIIESNKKGEPKKDTPEIEALKEQNKLLEKGIKDAKSEADRITSKIESDRNSQIKKDNKALENEVNRQLTKVNDLTEKRDKLQQGIRDAVKKQETKVDTPEIEALKKEIEVEDKKLRSLEATDKRVNDLETELQRLIDRKPKDTKVTVPKEITDREVELKEKIAEEKKVIAKEVKENAAPKTRQEQLADAKEALQKRIDEVREQIITKRADAVKDKTPLNKDAEYQQMEADYKALVGLKDKYLPKEGEKFVDEKKLKVAEKRIINEIENINKQIEAEQKNEKKKPDAVVSDNIKKLKTEKEARLAILEAVDPTPKEFVQETLIEKGFGIEVNIKTKTGVEKRTILDWKKLAGEEGSIDKIKANVESALKDKGYTLEQIDRIQNKFTQEYNDLRAGIIEKGLNVIAERNKVSVTPDQKSAAKKLAEMYNYGLFDKNLADYEVALSRTLGVDKLSKDNIAATITLGKALSTLYATDFQGKRLNESQIKSAINVIEEQMRYVLNQEVKKHGSTFLTVADYTRTYMDITQRMALVTMKQTLENPFSGQLESMYSGIGEGTKGLNERARKIGTDIFKEMVVQKGYQFGDVSSTFVNKGGLEMGLHNLPDNKLLQGVVSTMIGKSTLDAVDSAYKAKITQQKFTYNLIQILTKDRLIDGKIEKGMPKADAIKYVAEKLTGQSFKNAQETATNIIKKVNDDSGQKIFNDSPLFVDRLANDIVNAALVNGEKITEEMVTAAYNSAYKAAGRGLGHVANNFISEQVGTVSGKIETKINNAIKEKEYNKAAILTLESIFFRNIANPFVGGGTNWVVLKAEKSGLGLLSGLGSMMRRGDKMDLTTETGIKRLEQAMYENLKIKDKFIRGAVGGMTTVIAAMALQGITTTDDFKKWRDRNQWAKKYTDILTPEVWLGFFAKQDKKVDRYLSGSVNKNDIFDKSKMAIKAGASIITGSDKASAESGQLAGSMIGVPIPWRMIRDGDQIWVGIKGGEPYKIDNTKPETFMEGYFKGGIIDYLGYAPKPKESNTFSIETVSYLKEKGIDVPVISKSKKPLTIKNPNSLTKRDATEKEMDEYTKLRSEILDAKIKSIPADENIYINSYGEVTLSDEDVKEYKKGKDLTTDEIKKLIKGYRTQAANEAKEKIFGAGQDSDEGD